MLSVVTLDNSAGTAVTLHTDTPTSKRLLAEAHGLRGIQGLRQSKRVRPQAHGAINETKYEDGRNITLVGEIVSQVSIEDAFAEFALIAAPMIQTLDSGPALLKWTEGATGNALQRLVKLDGDLDPPFQEGQAILSYQAQFFAEDPRAYAQALSQVTSSTLGGIVGGLVTTGGNLVPRPSFAIDTAGWGTSGFGALNAGATLTRVSSGGAVFGPWCGQVVTTAALASEGIAQLVPGTFLAGQPYEVSAYIMGAAGGETLRLGTADNVLSDPQVTAVTATTSFVRYSLTYTPSADHTNLYVYVNDTTAAVRTFFVGGVMVQPGSVLNTYEDGAPFPWLFNPASGGIATVTQAGNRPTPPVFRIHGGVSNPSITRLSTGQKFSLLGSVSAPDYLEIDVQKRTIKLNGSSNALGFLDSAHTSWAMEVPANPTSETYVLAANGFDANAYLDVFYRSAYA